jgi:hypothetical protein
LEVIGIGIIVWIWRRERLADPDRRREVVRTGRLLLDESAARRLDGRT